MQNKRLKADISHTQNELLNDFRNKHELESQLDVIVKTGQKTQLDLEKTDLEFHGLTAEVYSEIKNIMFHPIATNLNCI